MLGQYIKNIRKEENYEKLLEDSFSKIKSIISAIQDSKALHLFNTHITPIFTLIHQYLISGYPPAVLGKIWVLFSSAFLRFYIPEYPIDPVIMLKEKLHLAEVIKLLFI